MGAGTTRISPYELVRLIITQRRLHKLGYTVKVVRSYTAGLSSQSRCMLFWEPLDLFLLCCGGMAKILTSFLKVQFRFPFEKLQKTRQNTEELVMVKIACQFLNGTST